VPRDEADVRVGKGLLAPVGRGGDDRLVLADQALEVVDLLQGDVVLFIAGFFVGAGLYAVGGYG
jgi:hypothetical protein